VDDRKCSGELVTNYFLLRLQLFLPPIFLISCCNTEADYCKTSSIISKA
jgi:hypothetical protein